MLLLTHFLHRRSEEDLHVGLCTELHQASILVIDILHTGEDNGFHLIAVHQALEFILVLEAEHHLVCYPIFPAHRAGYEETYHIVSG